MTLEEAIAIVNVHVLENVTTERGRTAVLKVLEAARTQLPPQPVREMLSPLTRTRHDENDNCADWGCTPRET